MQDLTPQVPAEGIVKQKSFSDMKYYKVPCSCGCDSNIDFMIEVDDNSIMTTFCSTTKTNHWRERLTVSYDANWLVLNSMLFFNDMYNRLAICWQALVHGYVQTESCVMLTPQQALNFSELLKTSIKDFEILAEERRAKIEAEKVKREAST